MTRNPGAKNSWANTFLLVFDLDEELSESFTVSTKNVSHFKHCDKFLKLVGENHEWYHIIWTITENLNDIRSIPSSPWQRGRSEVRSVRCLTPGWVGQAQTSLPSTLKPQPASQPGPLLIRSPTSNSADEEILGILFWFTSPPFGFLSSLFLLLGLQILRKWLKELFDFSSVTCGKDSSSTDRKFPFVLAVMENKVY